jgi:Xaa-Pro aminopeptidase
MIAHAERSARLIAELSARKLDALIVSAPANIRYLCGFTGSNGLLLVSRSATILFTDPRYAAQAAEQAACRAQIVSGRLEPALLKAASRRRLRKLAFEPGRITWQAWDTLNRGLPLGASLQPLPGVVESLRAVKDASEVAAIRRSVLTNSRAFERALRKLRPGITEAAFAAWLDHRMRLEGAEKPAFETIVASGPHAALPHAEPREVPIEPGAPVLVDMGCLRDGYASDMTRMVFTATPPARMRRLYRAVLEAQLAAVDAVRPGVTAAAVDRAARRVLRSHGMADLFIHSTGHGLGLEIHEPPRLGKRDATRLQAGMVVTVEPGAYIQGYGGVRIEDTVLVTETGCEVLTPTPKEMLVI